MPKLRQNPLTGEWVVIAPERAKRPQDYVLSKPIPKKRVLEFCNFCPGGEAYNSRIEEAGSEHVYVVKNKYPAFVPEEAVVLDAGKLYFSQKSIGDHEVICFLDHQKDLEELPPSHLEELFLVYQQRIRFHSQNPSIEYIMPIHNHGPEAGESIEHPHSQLFASCVIPNQIRREVACCDDFYQKTGRCLLCEIMAEEKKQKVRLVAENDYFLVFCAYAPRFPFEMWLVPKEHQARFEEMNEEERHHLSLLFRRITHQLFKGLNDPPYNFYLHTAPARQNHYQDYYHWHIEILPRLTTFGGYELGSGIVIDVVSPERAAEFLREVKVK